jgi:glutaminase
MINAGAIVSSAMVPGADAAVAFDHVRTVLSSFAGRDLEVDEAVFASEAATGDRNRALAHLTRAAGRLARSVSDAVEVYFRQCSLVVTSVDVAVMGATLANAGVNPRTGSRVVGELAARHTLSVMASCGMYDYSGEWMVRMGLPAKSGVGGGILAVAPGEAGIGVFSPPLDERGNSARGVAALELLSSQYGLHLLDHPELPRSPVERLTDTGDDYTLTLRGELDFLAVEEVAHLLAERHLSGAAGTFHLDLAAVTRARPFAGRLLSQIVADLRGEGRTVLLADAGGVLPTV